MPASIVYRQTATLLANQFSVTVALDHNLIDANYVIVPQLPYATKWNISGKTLSQFVFNVATANVADQTIKFVIFHQ
jgi:hypothetical protein